MDYGQYLDQITYLLFLKMADQRRVPSQAGWQRLQGADAESILAEYSEILLDLRARTDVVGSVYGEAISAFESGASLRKLVSLIDELDWANLDLDVQADAFEYLLEQAAAEGKKGAGQYFTPRELMRVIAACVQPGSVSTDRVIVDPAAGTGGFLIAAAEWMRASGLGVDGVRFHGIELVQRARRLAQMNLTLHGIADGVVERSDSLTGPSTIADASVVLVNPPFGSQGGSAPDRSDFWFRTTNKQANFVQLVVAMLEEGGRAALVLPDSCLFGETARGLWPTLLEHTDVHTVLRLPDGTFSPYTSGTRTNVIFLTKGVPTKQIWSFDARSYRGVERRPLVSGELSEFVACFGGDPYGRGPRTAADSPSGRWKQFHRDDIAAAQFEFDRVSWRAEAEALSLRATPEIVLREAQRDLELAAVGLQALLAGIVRER
jgi:type I restriction enzyme M protein